MGTRYIMEIAFRTKALRTVCQSKEAMDERYGPGGGELLRVRLADIRAAECLGDVPLLAISPIQDSSGQKAVIQVGGGVTIVVTANHQRPPKGKDGTVDWLSVDRILIQSVESTSA